MTTTTPTIPTPKSAFYRTREERESSGERKKESSVKFGRWPTFKKNLFSCSIKNLASVQPRRWLPFPGPDTAQQKKVKLGHKKRLQRLPPHFLLIFVEASLLVSFHWPTLIRAKNHLTGGQSLQLRPGLDTLVRVNRSQSKPEQHEEMSAEHRFKTNKPKSMRWK